MACNDDSVLRTCLRASPDIAEETEVVVQRGAPTAGRAYNLGMETARSEVLIFAHQDVWFPKSWIGKFRSALSRIEATDPDWGVAGICGVAENGARHACLYSTGLGRVLGEPFETPQPVRTLDEVLLAFRPRSGLRFDESLPGFHL